MPSALAFELAVPLTLAGGLSGADPGQPRWAGRVGWGLYGTQLALGVGALVLAGSGEEEKVLPLAIGAGVAMTGAFALGITQFAQNHRDTQVPTIMLPVFQTSW